MNQKEYERIQALSPAEFGKLPDDVKFAVFQHAKELITAQTRLSELAKKLADENAGKALVTDKAARVRVAAMVARKERMIAEMENRIAEIAEDIAEIEKQYPNAKRWKTDYRADIDSLFTERRQAREARKQAREKARKELVRELTELSASVGGMVNSAS